MTILHDKAKRWQFGLACVVVLALSVGLVATFYSFNGACDLTLYDIAADAYRSGSYSQAIVYCDNYLARYPSGDDADKVRELRRRARSALNSAVESSAVD